MKKLFFTAMMVAMASSSFAQDTFKQIKKIKDYDEAVKLIESNPSMSEDEKGKCYDYVCNKIAFAPAEKAYGFIAASNGQNVNGSDDVLRYINTAMLTNKYMGGKTKAKLCESANPMRVVCLWGAQAFLNNDNAKAFQFIETYVNSAYDPLFADVAGDKDQYVHQFARIGGLIAYQANDFTNAINYAKLAMKSPEDREEAENIYVASYEKTMNTKQDTLNYINVLKETNPQKYFGRMASLLNSLGETEKASKLIDDEIAANPTNKMAWATKGEGAMNARKWEAAVEAFKKTVEIDPAFTAVWFNLGVCSYSWAAELQEQLSDKQGKLTKENNDKVMAKIVEAKTYYEKTRELDPNYEAIPQWPRQLRMVYNQLGETEKAKEISKMLGDE